MTTPAEINDKAIALISEYGKNELVSMCRAKGWKGDPERAYTVMTTGAYIHQTDKAAQDAARDADELATGKQALAYWLAARLLNGDEQPAPAPQPEGMTAEQSQHIQAMLDDWHDLTGTTYSAQYGALTGNFADDRATLLHAIEAAKARKNQQQQPQPKDDKPMTTPQDKAALLAQLLSAPDIDEAAVKRMIDERLQAQQDAMQKAIADTATATQERLKTDFQNLADDLRIAATPREIKITTLAGVKELHGHTHPLFEKVLRLTKAGLNVLLTGAAGSGKTHLAEQVADALDLSYSAIHCTAGASESQLMGWLLPSDGGRFEYQPAPFVTAYETGNSLFLFDEIDAADPNFLLVANGALANGHIHVPQRREAPTVTRGANVSIMATANTYGTGSDMLYSGRNQLDAATLDRWYLVHIEYNEALEAEILGLTPPQPKRWKPAPTDEQTVIADQRELGLYIKGLRAKVEQHKMRRVISTRAFFKAQKARAAGIPLDEIKADLVAGWSKDELQKVSA